MGEIREQVAGVLCQPNLDALQSKSDWRLQAGGGGSWASRGNSTHALALVGTAATGLAGARGTSDCTLLRSCLTCLLLQPFTPGPPHHLRQLPARSGLLGLFSLWVGWGQERLFAQLQ